MDFNNINVSQWKNNHNVAVEIAKKIDELSWKLSPFSPFVGKGTDRGIRTYTIKNKAPFRPRIKSPLVGSGVIGNADFDSNLDKMEILSQTIFPVVVGNAIKSDIEQYQELNQIDFIKESSASLMQWYNVKKDKMFVCALSNDFTNGVVCDGANGIKAYNGEAHIKDMAKKIQKGDVVSVKALREAIARARIGLNFKGEQAYPMKPIKSDAAKVGGITIIHSSYVILLDTYQCYQLKNDPEWIAMQKQGIRGDTNNIFTGLIGLVDNCPVIDMGVWTSEVAGLLNSDVPESEFKAHINSLNFQTLTPPSDYADGQSVSIGALIGASALIYASDDMTKLRIKDDLDLGRKTMCGIDCVLGISKTRFEVNPADSDLSKYANSDYAVMGIFSSKE